MQIGNKKIGHGEPVFIIAEIGINHNGDMNIVKKLIDVAVDAECDAVKFQKRNVEIVYTKEELDMPRESPWGTTNREQKHGLEFTYGNYEEINNYCKQRGILWFASCWDMDSVNFIDHFNPPCHKIASAFLTDGKMLKSIKSKDKPIILSTGMSTLKEINDAVNLLGEDTGRIKPESNTKFQRNVFLPNRV
jgi:N-acetylneuraminate synthase